jgi:nucleotide-binding universal stress UspA family protein
MIAANTTQVAHIAHIVLPMVDPTHERGGFQVARTLARSLNASLQVTVAGKENLAPADFARQLAVPAEQLNDVAITHAAGDLADATIRSADALQSAMVILAIRIREDASTHDDAQSLDAVGQQVLEKVTCSILIVPPERDMSGWRLRRELLPQDGTPGCASVLATVIEHATRRGIENLVLRVAGANVGQPAEPGSLATPRYVDHPQYEWEAWGREFLDRLTGMGANATGAGLRLLMASGEPAAEILRVAQEEGVDMIILPWHCEFGSGRARMIKAVLHGAACPVLMLPEPCEDRAAKSGVH